ncbi:hypothetical protein GC169_08525 [bacterium]|nr:hypothetical protein [bacterium]
MPWAASAIAITGWAGAGFLAYATVGVDGLLALDPVALAGGALIAIAPGLAIIAAGFMARESRRSSETNALVMSSARLLLEPAETSRDELSTVASVIAREAGVMTKAIEEAHARVEKLKADVEGSVNSVLKAAEVVRADSDVLVSRMSGERQNMVQLSEALRGQTEALAEAIPRYAQTMAEATKLAHNEVAKAEEALDQRLRGVDDASRRLAERIDHLDTMGAESRKRAQALVNALSRLDEQLNQSARMVDSATKAGELAAVASKGTADALRDATSDALDRSLKASETISMHAAEAAKKAHEAMLRLKEAGQEAEATTRSASLAARAQAEDTEQRINRLADYLFNAVARATHIAEAGIETARNRIGDDPGAIDPLAPEAEQAPGRADPAKRIPKAHKPTATADFETAMREAGAPARLLEGLRTPAREAGERLTTSPGVPLIPPRPAPPAAGDARVETMNGLSHGEEPSAEEAPQANGRTRGPLSWRDLLTGLEDAPPSPVDEQVAKLLARLGEAGVHLADTVKASDLRRIASAAHHGERQRRRAIRDVAPTEIQRVVKLLEDDSSLEAAAREFVAVEEPEALRLLSGAERARENADPRLSAFLFLDAALGTVV